MKNKAFYIASVWLFSSFFMTACQKPKEDTSPMGELPNTLIYFPNTLYACSGSDAVSSMPTIKGTEPINFSFTSNPANPHISLAANGIIQVAANSPLGAFSISIKASNMAGSQTFSDVYIVKVSQLNPAGISFEKDVKPLVISRCSPCHTDGGARDFSVYDNARKHIQTIIQRTENGSMPLNALPLNQTEIDKFKNWRDNCFLLQ